jgi:hypothetical protein
MLVPPSATKSATPATTIAADGLGNRFMPSPFGRQKTICLRGFSSSSLLGLAEAVTVSRCGAGLLLFAIDRLPVRWR